MEELKINAADGQNGARVLRLEGPLTLRTIFDFQTTARQEGNAPMIIDLSGVPYMDSAGIGALVGAYVTRQKDGRSLGLVGVNQRIHNALEVTRVENFFRFYGTVAEAEQAA